MLISLSSTDKNFMSMDGHMAKREVLMYRRAFNYLMVPAVVLLALALVPASAQAYTSSKTINFTSAGQNMIFAFTGLPTATSNVSVKVDLYGDYNASNEYAEVWIDNFKQTNHTGGGNCSSTASSRTYLISPLYVADTTLTVRVDNSYNVGTQCTTNRAVVTLTYTSQPDLRVSGSTVPYSGSTAGPGSQFTARYNITADHAAVSTNFYARFYYCPTNNSTSGCSYLGQQSITQNFAANTTRTFTSQTLTMPTSASAGTRYLRILVDPYNSVSESNETNNNRWDAITVTSTSDLYFTASTVPYSGSTAGPGANFRGRYTIRNATTGVYFSTNFVVRYYYCPGASTTGCVSLGTQTITNNFSPGESYSFTSPNLTMPSSATAGTRYIRAFVDSTNVVGESNENNNNDYDAITVTGATTPDLTVSASTVPYTGATTGPGSTFTARYTITAANGAVSNNFTVNFYYCTYNNSTYGCTGLGQQAITSTFTAGQSLSFTSQTLTLPSSATNGTRYIRIYVDSSGQVSETNESNNNRWDSITVNAKPDLYFTASTVPYSGSTAGPGHTFTGRYTIRNAPTGISFSTNFNVRYYYCPAASTTGCVYLGNQSIYNNFSAGESYSFTSPTLTMPSSATAGTRYIRAFVDGSNNVSETNEANNNDYDAITVTGAGTVDLTVNASTAPYTGSTAGAGTAFTVRYRVRNAGPGTVATPFYTYFYYCTSQWGTGCTLIGNQYITQNIGAAKEVWFTSGSLTLPNSATRGTRYIRFYVDATNTVSETTGNNNYRYDAISVTTYPDLSFASGTVPYTGSTTGAGSTFTGRYTITNGAKTTYFSTNFYVRYYYCTSTSTSSCTQLTSQYLSNNFDAGESYTFNSPTLTLPSSATKGTRYIRAYVDANGSVTESNEGNNNLFSSIAVGSTLPDLMADITTVPYTGSTAGAGSTFTARYRVRNGGAGATTAGFTTSFHYCPTSSTTGCTSLGSQTVSTKLTAGQTTFVTSQALKVPAQARYGAGYVRIYVDSANAIKEANENNNNVWDYISVTNRPDIYVSASTAPYTGDTAKGGSKFTGRYTIVNGATTSAFTNNFTVSYHYCPAVSTSGCVLIGSQSITADFNAGTSYTFTSSTLTLPAAATNGTRYVRAHIDSANSVSEYNENNNVDYEAITVGATPADLYVKSFNANVSGTTVTYAFTLCNKGGTTTPNTVVGIYYHLPAAPLCNAKFSSAYTILAVKPSACTSRTLKRHNVPKGAYMGWVMADYNCKLNEASETNNVANAVYSVAQVMADAGPTPDTMPPADMQPATDTTQPPADMGPPPPDMQPGEGVVPPPDMQPGENPVPPPDMQPGENPVPPPDMQPGENPVPPPDMQPGENPVPPPDMMGEGTVPPDQFTGDGLPPQEDKGAVTESGPPVADGSADMGTTEPEQDGCNCSVNGQLPASGAWLLLLAGLAMLLRRRRR